MQQGRGENKTLGFCKIKKGEGEKEMKNKLDRTEDMKTVATEEEEAKGLEFWGDQRVEIQILAISMPKKIHAPSFPKEKHIRPTNYASKDNESLRTRVIDRDESTAHEDDGTSCNIADRKNKKVLFQSEWKLSLKKRRMTEWK
ncbi:hypothetical protein CDAR_538581 [Caerostris darwini]|uniref:Uncharacterized protein n=1 Tax=Caerostris darwini TaxID=1538125 RepID=A0AAV4UCS3_9ARAC|nr:hypothetical protein CDAR_538581 [Caerostris darwini]